LITDLVRVDTRPTELRQQLPVSEPVFIRESSGPHHARCQLAPNPRA
jgi:hypothetical protein